MNYAVVLLLLLFIVMKSCLSNKLLRYVTYCDLFFKSK